MVTPTIPIPSPELAPILDRIRARLLELPADVLYETGKAVPMWVSASFNKKGVRSKSVAFTTTWKDAATLAKSLKKGSLEILEVGLWVLEAIDRERALEEALAICALPRLRTEDVTCFNSLVRDRAEYVVSRNADLLPVETLLNLAARGHMIEDTAAVERHPLLQAGDGIVKALQQSQWAATPPDAPGYPRDRDLAEYFLKSLVTLEFRAGVSALEEIFRKAGSHEIRWRIARTLEDLGSTLPQKTLIAMAAEGLLKAEGPINPAGDRRWPPILKWAVLAVFAADPRTAYDKLTRYLDRPCLTEAFVTHGTITTVADAIAAVLEPRRSARKDNILHIHDGDVSARIDQLTYPDKFVSAEPEKSAYYEADPRWTALIERMASEDPWWERYAWRFQDLSVGTLEKKMRAWERRQPPPSPAEKKRLAGIRREYRASTRENAKQSKKDG